MSRTASSEGALSRREFLKAGATGGAALVIGFYLPSSAAAQAAQEQKAVNPFNAFIRIDKSGQVTLMAPRPDLGEGLTTSLPMILADELEVDWKAIHVERAPFAPNLFGEQGVGGSDAVTSSWLPLRRAAAAAREMLVTAAAQEWNVSRETCQAKDGAVHHGPRSKQLTYGELVEAAAKLPIPNFNTVPLKNPDNFHIVGTAIPRVDIPEKVDGSGIFGIDVRIPGMLYAVVARCPTFGGKAAKFDSAKAKAIPGVRDVIEIPAVDPDGHTAGGLAVLADSTWAAIQGREALEIEWDHGPHANETSESLRQQFVELIEKPGKVIRNDGDADAALTGARKKIEAVYEVPFLAHATMEPMNCTAQIRPDGAEVWAPTQAPDWAAGVTAHIAGVKPEQVTVHMMLAGGGFGRRYQSDFAIEAAQIAKAAGKPVHLTWTREDDMQHDFYRPAHYQRLTASLDDKGNIAAWKHRVVSTSIRVFWGPAESAKPEAQEIGGAAQLPYAIPNVRVEYTPAPSGVPRAWWRSVEASVSGYVVESFLDELAAAAGVDPLEYRLRLLGEPRKVKDVMWPDNDPLDTARLKAVLQLAAQKAGWGKPVPAGRGRGISCHFSFNTYVAQVAEVSVARNGKPRVHRVVCAVDCGRAVNPDGVKAQMEGGIVYGLSAALMGEITIEGGAVKQNNFNGYPVVRMREMPEIEVHIVPSQEKPTGVGEPGLPPLASAVTNAIFAATGKRIRRLPIRVEDLKQG